MMRPSKRHKYYQRLESGQVNPTLVALQKLADAFEVSVYDLFRPELHYGVRVRLADKARQGDG